MSAPWQNTCPTHQVHSCLLFHQSHRWYPRMCYLQPRVLPAKISQKCQKHCFSNNLVDENITQLKWELQFKVDRLQIIVVAKKYIYVSQLFISRMPKMRAIPQLVSAPLNPIPIAEHFRRSHPPCEHSRGQQNWLYKREEKARKKRKRKIEIDFGLHVCSCTKNKKLLDYSLTKNVYACATK